MAVKNRVKTMVPRACSTLEGRPEVKEKLHSFFPLLADTKSQATPFVAYDWTTKPSTISPIRHVEPHISLSIQWLQVMVSSRRMDPSDLRWHLPGKRV